ncbi:hypothetical protein F4780DRAFT_159917 [Xylariomycetidae sp. FL0641]|nr:hypothetical protein F4780DRAFT_159917 [Xylariomycetidae sp. FL0641]
MRRSLSSGWHIPGIYSGIVLYSIIWSPGKSQNSTPQNRIHIGMVSIIQISPSVLTHITFVAQSQWVCCAPSKAVDNSFIPANRLSAVPVTTSLVYPAALSYCSRSSGPPVEWLMN